MYDHFRPPDHFTFWQGILYRLAGLAFVAVGLILLAVYVMPWLDIRYFSPFADWFAPRFAALFGGHDIIGGIVFFLIIGAPWAASHLYARRLAKRNREKASGNPSQ
jgi:hypothetical protein